jgi:hypothetical protein
MCSNFGLNLHPGRKPCALQWQWYNFFTRLWSRLRRRYFPKALYMYEGRGGIGRPGDQERR